MATPPTKSSAKSRSARPRKTAKAKPAKIKRKARKTAKAKPAKIKRKARKTAKAKPAKIKRKARKTAKAKPAKIKRKARKTAKAKPAKIKRKARKSAKAKPRKAAPRKANAKPSKATRKARSRKAGASSKRSKTPFIHLEDGTRVAHNRVCRFPIEPFVPLIQKLVEVWVMPAGRVEAALQRLLNPGAEVGASDHYRTVGCELFEWGYYIEALDCFERLLRVQPNDLKVLELKINAHENIGEADEARAWRTRLRALRRRRPTGQRYLLDQFSEALVTSLTDVATRHRTSLMAPIEHMVLGLQEAGSIVPDELWLSIEGSSHVDLELSLTLPDTLIPLHVDRLRDASIADDPLLEFVDRFQLGKNIVSWSDPARVPVSLFHLELSGALQQAVARLTSAGIEVASRCALAVGHRGGDVMVVDRNKSRQRAREQATRTRIGAELQRFPGPDAVEAFAWLCYEQPKRRDWLIALAR